MKHCHINQMPSFADDKTAEYNIENIRVVIDKTVEPRRFSYFLMEYNEKIQDWTSTEVSKQEAEKLCEVELPNVFYE